MPPLPDTTGPTTSYSDPIYDRLESVAQRLARRLALVILALVVGIVIAVVIHSRLQNSPDAASANAFVKAENQMEEASHDRDPTGSKPTTPSPAVTAALTAMQNVAADATITPFFRSRAFIDLVQHDLEADSVSDAKAHAAKAVELARTSGDADLLLKASLSGAAVQLQTKDYAEAEKAYLQLERQAGARAADSQIVAVLGAAKAMEMQGRLEDAATKLESITSRMDSSAQQLVQLARQQYLRLKRQISEKANPSAATAPTAVAAPAAPAAPAVAPAAPAVAPAPAAHATPAPAAPTQAPATK